MRRLSIPVIGAVSLITLTQLGFAADLSVKAPVYKAAVAEVYNWTGFYAGVNLGGHWSRDNDPAFTGFNDNFFLASVALFNAALPHSLSPSGIAGGVQVGYNWQVSNFLLGIEADFDGLGGSKTRTVSGEVPPVGVGNTFQFSDTASVRWMSTVRARAGLLVTDRFLVFATGGGAFASWNLSHSFVAGPNFFVAPANTASTTVRTGWTAGGGIEYALSKDWLLRAEYLYANFGTTTNVLDAPAPPFDTKFNHPETLSVNLARVAVSYKFGGR
jgi:outer membrane immunogenic protein